MLHGLMDAKFRSGTSPMRAESGRGVTEAQCLASSIVLTVSAPAAFTTTRRGSDGAQTPKALRELQ